MSKPQTVREQVKYNYDKGLWTVDHLSALVRKERVTFTREDFKQITGQAYVEVKPL